MNFLAHCFLSCRDEELLIGNLITDFLNPTEAANYYGRIADGIELHRIIDNYTDEHPVSIKLRTSLRKRHGKYASVVVDLIWDYYLSINWVSYAESSLNDFTGECYNIIFKHLNKLPKSLKPKMLNMVDNDFLNAYNGLNRAYKSLSWMDRRAKFPSQFTEAIYDIEENNNQYSEWFMSFFPDMIKHIESKSFC